LKSNRRSHYILALTNSGLCERRLSVSAYQAVVRGVVITSFFDWPKYRKSGGCWSFLAGISMPSALGKFLSR
jgi:hypothetical protein